MRISAQMIVFNAASIMPKGMLRACIESIYPVVDEVIIAEGATLAKTGHAWDGDTTSMTRDGHSTDDTVSIIETAPDPEKKIVLLRNKNGFWNGKTEMCNACAEIATGDYIWQIDADEFYHEREVPKILELLEKEKPDAVHFFAYHFWGGYKDCMDENERRWGNDVPWMRIFKNSLGSRWVTHEPPEYKDVNGKLCNKGNVITRDVTLALGLHLYHYGYVHEKQVEFKEKFFRNNQYLPAWKEWHKSKRSPTIAGARTTEFTGSHPSKVRDLITRETQ